MNLKRFLIIAVAIIAIVFVVLKFTEKHPMSGEKFNSIMNKYGFRVIDNIHIKEEDMLYESRIPAIDFKHDPIESYSSINNSQSSEFKYYIFPSDEDAIYLVNQYRNAKKLDVTRDQKTGDYNYKSLENKTSHRNGDNYQRTYIEEFDDRYFLISRIENTLLLASLHEDDTTETNKLLGEIGY